MASRNFTIFFAALFLFFEFSEKAPAQIRDKYIVKAGSEELHFVQRPDLGYVVQAKKEEEAIKSLEENLKQFKAKNVLRVGGRGRKGLSVVLEQRPAGENRNTIADLQAQNHIRYAAPLFSAGGETETVAIIPEVVIRVIRGTNRAQLESLCRTLGLSIKERLEFTNLEYLIEIQGADADSVFQAVEQLRQQNIVQWAVPNVAFRPRLLGQVIPNDEYFPNQWHLNNTRQSGGTPGADINAPKAWDITTGNPNIVVAVLDEGVDTDHPDLINNIVAGYDFVDDDNDPNPTGDDAHGTACAGLIAGKGNNGIGVTGVAWNCKIMPIRISGVSGFITEAEIATAIRWAANNGADVLSNSWGGNFEMPTIHSAIMDAAIPGGIGRDGKGCVVLFASGNWSSGGSVIYPAKYPEVIAVGATNHNDVVWYYSGSGWELDIVAPSGDCDLLGNIWTTDIFGSAGYNNRDSNILDYMDKMGGTSAACPIAAGVAALILSINQNLTNIQVQDILQTTAFDLGNIGFDIYYGYGRIDAKGALDIIPSIVLPEQKWVSRYNDFENGSDYANALAIDDFGNAYVTGKSYSSTTGYDYTTIKYDTNGNELWVKYYYYDEDKPDFASDITVDSFGNVYVTGNSYRAYYDAGSDWATIKYDSNGEQLWVNRYNGPDNSADFATDLAIDNSNNLYVTGSSHDGITGDDCVTIKYDPNGNELWIKRYNSLENGWDSVSALAVDGSGNVYITGYKYGGVEGYAYLTIKYDTNGNELWTKSYNGPKIYKDDKASALALDRFGNIYVTGSSDGSTSAGYTNMDYTTIKYDANGNELWARRYNGPGDYTDEASAIGVDDFGNVYVTGKSYSSTTGYDCATVKYDADGNKLWVKRSTESDYAVALAVDDFGNVYLTGYSIISHDYVTIKYSTKGTQLWSTHYNGLGYSDSSAHALGIDNLGNVYVTGESTGNYTECEGIAAGKEYGLALKTNGSIIGWGNNYSGQATPPDGNNYIAIAAGGYHGLALKYDGSIVAWGWNSYGQATPPEGNDFVAIAAGDDHSLALRSDGFIVGWGDNGSGQTTSPDGNDFVAIAAGEDYSLALKTDGSIIGWGDNSSGRATPPEGNNYIAIAAGGYHGLALKYDGSIVGWGDTAAPPDGNNFVAIAAGLWHSLALKSDGSIVGWGDTEAQPDGNNFVAIAAGSEFSLALRSELNGTVVGWGRNDSSQATPGDYDYATIKYTQRNYCTQPLSGDLDGDCGVNLTDFAILGYNWLGEYDIEDLAMLANDWLECNFALEDDCW